MRTIAFLLLSVTALVLIPGTTWADTCMSAGDGQCFMFSGGSTLFQTTQVPASTTMLIQGFNPALGTLDEVDCLNCSQAASGGSATMTITVTNLNPFPEPYEVAVMFMRITVRTPSNDVWIDGVDEFDCFHGPLEAGASQTTACADHQFELASSPLVSPADLAEFISAGNVPAPVSFDQVVFGSLAFDTGEVVTFDSASMNVNVDLAYVYTPTQIPEPASDALLLTALLIGLPTLRIWRRSRPI